MRNYQKYMKISVWAEKWKKDKLFTSCGVKEKLFEGGVRIVSTEEWCYQED